METKDVILALRTRNGLSQDELAEKVFVTRQAVSRWENGETTPNTETLKLLSRLFDVSINTLLGSPRELVCKCCGILYNLRKCIKVHFKDCSFTHLCHSFRFLFDTFRFSNCFCSLFLERGATPSFFFLFYYNVTAGPFATKTTAEFSAVVMHQSFFFLFCA